MYVYSFDIIFILLKSAIFSDVLSVAGVSQQVMAKTLHDYLMTDYDSNLIPLCSTGSKVTLNMDLALRQIMDVVSEQFMTFMFVYLFIYEFSI